MTVTDPTVPTPRRPKTCVATDWHAPGRAADGKQTASAITYLTLVLKTATIGRTFADLDETARDERCTQEAGTALRMGGTHSPAVKALDDFNPDLKPSLRATSWPASPPPASSRRRRNVALPGPPGPGNT